MFPTKDTLQFNLGWQPRTHPWIIRVQLAGSGIPTDPLIKKDDRVSLYPVKSSLYVSVRVTSFDNSSQKGEGVICWRPRSLAKSFPLDMKVLFEKQHVHSLHDATNNG